MAKTTLLTSFTPSLMAPEALEALLVGRERLAERIIQAIRESSQAAAIRHLLLVGPHGIGKTHLVSLIYHRIESDAELRNRLVTAWLREDEWGVTTFLDLLLRILRALPTEQPSMEIAERVEALYQLEPEVAEQAAGGLLRELVGDRVLLVIIENLEDVFRGLGEQGQKQLRTYLDSHRFCAFLATSQTVFDGVTDPGAPLRGYFQIHALEELSPDHAMHMLGSIAGLKGDRKLVSFIHTPAGRARIRALLHLAGGNHRICVIFSKFLNRSSLDQIEEPLMQALDELTPHYHARMAWISPQQRKLVEFLCEQRGAVTVRDIARHCFMTHQTASGQLKTLREMRYVRAEAVGRDSYYELHEPLMRLCLDVKKRQGEPLRLLVRFLKSWYDPCDATLDTLEVDTGWKGDPPETAFDEQRVDACLSELEFHAERGNFDRALPAAEELVVLRGRSEDWCSQGHCLARIGEELQALAAFEKATVKDPAFAPAWLGKGWVLNRLGRYEKALVSLRRAMDAAPGLPAAAFNAGITLCRLGRHEEALAHFRDLAATSPEHPLPWAGCSLALNRLADYLPSLNACDRALELGSASPALLILRAENLLALRDWEEGSRALDAALESAARAGSPLCMDADRVMLYIFDFMRSPDARDARIETLIGLYERRGALMSLGQALAKNIPAAISEGLSSFQAGAWLGLWQDAAGERPELQIPLRLLSAAVRYRLSADPRALLELPVEYRNLLKPLFAKTASAPR